MNSRRQAERGSASGNETGPARAATVAITTMPSWSSAHPQEPRSHRGRPNSRRSVSACPTILMISIGRCDVPAAASRLGPRRWTAGGVTSAGVHSLSSEVSRIVGSSTGLLISQSATIWTLIPLVPKGPPSGSGRLGPSLPHESGNLDRLPFRGGRPCGGCSVGHPQPSN